VLKLAETGSNASPMKMIKFKSGKVNDIRSKLTLNVKNQDEALLDQQVKNVYEKHPMEESKKHSR
jgi:hypothetical protein